MIEKIVYINMDSRTDRRNTIVGELRRVGFPDDCVQRFPAICYNGCANTGCLLSHANVLEMAYNSGYANVLVLEDDFVFIDDTNKVKTDLQTFFEMNLAWDVVMLTTCGAVVSENTNHLVSRISSSGNGAGYLVNRSMMLELSTLFKSNVDNLFLTKQHWNYQNDILWKSLMPASQWFMFNQYLGYQQAGYSDLSQDDKVAIIPQVVGTLPQVVGTLPQVVGTLPQVVGTLPQVVSASQEEQEKIQVVIEEMPSTQYTSDSVVNTVIESFIKRSNIGLQKYGTTLDRDDLKVLDWIQHAQEEHMDAILYLEKLKREVIKSGGNGAI